MSEPYNGQAAERAAKAKARYITNGGYPSKRAAQLAEARKQLGEARDAIKFTISLLEEDHVQNNKFRMGALGALGAQNIIWSIEALKKAIR